MREALSSIFGELELALLYGSVASRRDTARSDFDVLLVSDTLTLEQVYETLAPAEKQLGRLISPTLFTHTEIPKRLRQQNSFLTMVLAGDITTLMGDKDAFIAAG